MNKTFDPTNFDDVTRFMGNLNKAIYGVNPFTKEEETMKKDEMEEDTHDCHLSPDDGCTHPSHPQI